MKILLINNNTQHIGDLANALAGHDVEMQLYQPGLKFNEAGKDMVVLSGGGGEGQEANDYTPSGSLWYQDEIDFILATKLPIVGICMGFELIAQAYGSKVETLPELVQGWNNVSQIGKKFGQSSNFKQFEAHRWGVHQVSQKHFDVLAQSDSGIEIIRHKNRPIFASQFHPEIPGSSLKLNQLVKCF